MTAVVGTVINVYQWRKLVSILYLLLPQTEPTAQEEVGQLLGLQDRRSPFYQEG